MQTTRTKDLTSGNITQSMLCLAYPLILGNLLQQGYNIADTLIIGQVLGANALAAVGSSYTLMVFITSIFIGLCMGCSALFSMRYGAKDYELLKRTQAASLLITGIATFLIFTFSISCIRPIIQWLQTPEELQGMTYDYLKITFIGIWFVYLYNYYAYLLRALGNSFTPLVYLAISVVLNIGLDLLFILRLGYGIAGAATSRFRHRTLAILLEKNSGNTTYTKRFQDKPSPRQASIFVCLADVHTAIGHELRDSDGTGAGQQFRHLRHGRLHRSR